MENENSELKEFKLHSKENTLMHDLYMQSPIAVGIYIGKDHLIAFANPKMCEIWGRTIEQVADKPLFKALPEVAGQGFEEILAEVYKTGKAFEGNGLQATLERNGKEELLYFNILYKPLLDSKGKIIGIIQTATEVTDLVVARKKIERNKEILNFALKSGKIGTWHLDFRTGIIERSVHHDLVFGYNEPVKDWSSNSFLDHVLAEDLAMVKMRLQEGIENGNIYCKARIQWPDKSIHWVEFIGKAAYDNQGKPLSSSGIIKEITEQKLAEEKEKQLANEEGARKEAERQKEVLEQLFMEAPALICTLKGPKHLFDFVNTLYQEQLFPGRPLKDKEILVALPELAQQPVIDMLDGVYKTGKTFIGNEVPVEIDRNGKRETLYFNFVYQAHRDLDGKIIGILVFAFEITEQINARKQVEESERKSKAMSMDLSAINEELLAANEEIGSHLEDLSLSNDQLKRINSDLDNFIYTASHDLKAPILNIEGLIKLLEKNLTESDLEKAVIKKIINSIHASIERFKKTIGNLTDITKVQKQEEENTVIHISDVVNEVILDLQTAIDESGANVMFKKTACKPLSFSYKNIYSVVHNLVANAIKYRDLNRKSEIALSCWEEQNQIVLCVKDNGLGIKEKNIPKIFSMFTRLHNHVEGSGVGLYLVKRVLDNAGGKIEVESEEGIGTTFKVYIPFRMSSARM